MLRVSKMTHLSGRNVGLVLLACVGLVLAVREAHIHRRAVIARDLYDAVTSSGGYIVTHELSNYWTINIQSAELITVDDSRMISQVLDRLPDDIAVGLVANVKNPAKCIATIADHARCDGMLLVNSDSTIPELAHLVEAIPDKRIRATLTSDNEVGEIVESLRTARPNATIESTRYRYD